MKILLIPPTNFDDKMAGPSIRYYNFLIELGKKHDVIVLLSELNEFTRSLPCYMLNKKNVKKMLNWCDIVITQGLTLFHYPSIKNTKKVLVIDLYDPFILENLEIRKKDFVGKILYRIDLKILREQLLAGDFFICSNQRQIDYWIGSLSIVGAIDVNNYYKRKKISDIIGIVPFGIPSEVPQQTSPGVLRDKTEGFSNDDFIVQWAGGSWKWLDIETVIKAFSIIKTKNEKVKLFIMGGKQNAELKELCLRYDVLGKNVILGDWIPYNKRQDYLLDSDIGLVTHFDILETRYSHRTRVLDYIWCSLPIVSTMGDYLSDVLIEKKNVGVNVDYENPNELADVILNLSNDMTKLDFYKSNLDNIHGQLKWSNVMEDLLRYCENPMKIAKYKSNPFTFFSSIILTNLKWSIYHFRKFNKKVRK